MKTVILIRIMKSWDGCNSEEIMTQDSKNLEIHYARYGSIIHKRDVINIIRGHIIGHNDSWGQRLTLSVSDDNLGGDYSLSEKKYLHVIYSYGGLSFEQKIDEGDSIRLPKPSYTYFSGWLYANKSEYDRLRDMGIFGPMVYIPNKSDVYGKDGRIDYCYCELETLITLKEHYKEVHFVGIGEEEMASIRSSDYDRVATNGEAGYEGGKFWNWRGARSQYQINCRTQENETIINTQDNLGTMFTHFIPKVGDVFVRTWLNKRLYRERWNQAILSLFEGDVSVRKVLKVEEVEKEWKNEYTIYLSRKYELRIE